MPNDGEATESSQSRWPRYVRRFVRAYFTVLAYLCLAGAVFLCAEAGSILIAIDRAEEDLRSVGDQRWQAMSMKEAADRLDAAFEVIGAEREREELAGRRLFQAGIVLVLAVVCACVALWWGKSPHGIWLTISGFVLLVLWLVICGPHLLAGLL